MFSNVDLILFHNFQAYQLLTLNNLRDSRPQITVEFQISGFQAYGLYT